ncbi:MAG TPA: DNA polymerase III subunit gamma/tau [Acidimicrobiia bacterium]|nr:DNA polymerase III subunit gamma/tau [Acidimicrobiia bacterium]
MAYQSLYRKHRPQTFGGLVGQDHVTAALRNAVSEGRVGHAYLFSGPRGTGKTTTARILAKALNCLNLGADGEPCGVCENCVAIAEGRFLDLFELDAASNNSVDNIRDLTDSVHLGLGATSKRKVYLVDEVQMLSAAASNALLKTLEEPPEHVVFVLATTNPEKVLPTIRSRTQHLEFTLLPADELEKLLADVLGQEGIEADPEALAVIARAAAGSARDALSLLDQALAHGTDRLDAGAVADLFGGTPFDLRAAVLDAVAAEDPAGVLVAVGALLDAGHEPRRIAEDVLRSVRDAFLLNASSGQVRVDAPEDEQRRLDELGRTLGNTTLVRVLETLGQAVVDMRGTDAADPRLVLEIALVRLTRREVGPPIQTVMERIEKLEQTVAGQRATGTGTRPEPPAAPESRAPGVTVGALRKRRPEPAPPADAEPEAVSDAPDPAPAEPNEPTEPKSAAEAAAESEAPTVDVDDVILAWATVLPELSVATRSAVQEAQPLSVDGDVVTFGVSPRLIEAARPRFRREANTIRDALSRHVGTSLRFNLVPHEGFSGERAASPQAALPDAEPDESDDLIVEPDESATPPGVESASPANMLTESLGATVVEERHHE